MKRRCDTCEFWSAEDSYHRHQNEAANHPDDYLGECRRRAPSPTTGAWHRELLNLLALIAWYTVGEEDQKTEFKSWEDSEIRFSAWPGTLAVDWCGEWTPVTSEAAQ